MICKSIGMRIAFFETDGEVKNLGAIARIRTKLFSKKIFIDGKNLTGDKPIEDAKSCYSVQKQLRSKLEIKTEECNGQSSKFLCEDIEVVDSYVDPIQSFDTVDVKETFFSSLGRYSEIYVY